MSENKSITEHILDEWDIDSIIDDNKLDIASVIIPKLHSKYVRYISQAKAKRIQLTNDFNVLKKIRFRYYRGELTRDELIQYQWDQWQGNKPMKNEMEQFLNGDELLNGYKLKLELIESRIYVLEEILKQLNNRSFQIKNSIEYKKFVSGG